MKKILKTAMQKNNFRRIVLPIILVIVLALIGYFSFKSPAKSKNLSPTEAQAKAETFVNKFLMQSGSKATIKEITEEYGLYKLKIDIISDVVDSYLTRDGKLFFPQALDIDKISNPAATEPTSGNSATQPAAMVSKKSDKPSVELFVMSYCPYGTQIEKGLLPVLETLGNKINFELKFCDYAMHGEKELTENLLQYCIQEEQPDKLAAYLQCFLADSQSATCLETAWINQKKVDACVAQTDKQYKVSANFAAKVGWQGSYPGFDVNKEDNDKYQVGGSPTLIINGEEIQSARDSASLLATICSAFNTPPAECNTSLSSASPSAGFGFNAAASGAPAAECN